MSLNPLFTGTSRLWATLILLSLLATPASAEIVSSQAPISIEADSAELQEELSTYTGNVEVVQGSVTMRGGRLIVRSGQGNSFTFTLSGNPAHIIQASTRADEPDIHGSAQRIDYASGSEILELRGNAIINRGKEKISGGDIRYSFRDRRTVVNNRGGGGNGRVKITLQPNGPALENNSNGDGEQQ